MRTSPLALLGLSLLIIAFWLLIHPFRGVEHDSTLYTLLALGRLHPESLGQDLFVRYGTQNEFTIFSPIYATLSRAVGFERAAAVLTLWTHAGFFSCAWLLARRFMPAARHCLPPGCSWCSRPITAQARCSRTRSPSSLRDSPRPPSYWPRSWPHWGPAGS